MTHSTLSVFVVVPTFNPGPLWTKWLSAVVRQQPPLAGVVVDSTTTDGTDYSTLPPNWQMLRIPNKSFNHGSTRNLGVQQAPSGHSIVVFMTQDAVLVDAGAVDSLVAALADPAVACAWGRQLPHGDATPIAAHARTFNYPPVSRVVQLSDKDHLGLKACFTSNSFAAYRMEDLMRAGGFPSELILGEDMAVAAKLLMAGKKVAYVADACVYHSHNYTPVEEFRRYFDTGVFHARNPWLLETFGSANSEGLRFVRSELRYLRKHAPAWIPSAMLRTLLKWLGYRLGRLEAHWPLWIKRRCSMHRGYWKT